ncbi:ATP-dependent zinc protease, partial [Pseudomonas aeruginosa]|nr:ATP-dependent zinc protease [Pseudomonas aeruginosa]
FSLRDRGNMKYPVLLGRRTLEHLGAVDVSRTFTSKPTCSALAAQ